MNTRKDRKDYVRAAAMIRDHPNPMIRNAQARFMVKFFRTDNPRFDEDRFYKAALGGEDEYNSQKLS